MTNIKVSFCIPTMNRLKDIQATLRKNLEDNREDRDSIEFIILSFDSDSSTKEWINNNFKEDLDTGYLKFYISDKLKFWHFGKAKNAFKDLMNGEIYASLDGDNYTGYRGGKHILDIFEKYQYKCIFHQFQGDWGDGTCGRVSMAKSEYIEIGYDESFLPRQWDELDAMLSILVNKPNVKYVCYEGKSIFNKSKPFNRYFVDHNIQIDQIELDAKQDPLYSRIQQNKISEGQHNSNYVRDDAALKYSSIFNHLSSYIKNTKNISLKNKYISEIVEVQREIIDILDSEILLKWFLERQNNHDISFQKGDVLLISCVKNEANLKEWYQYYKKLGVNRFLLIDDYSSHKIINELPYEDVYVWKPICGNFRYAKVLWMEIILLSFARDYWVLTVDGDEYLTLPELLNSKEIFDKDALKLLIDYAESKNKKYFGGFLLDIFPSGENYLEIKNNEFIPIEQFTNFQYREVFNSRNIYLKQNTVKWSYGVYGDWAASIDIRFRLNGSFDSLRKFPFLKYKHGIHLNQGFHDLIIDKEKRTYKDLSSSDLLPLIHYKLYVTQLDAETNDRRPTNVYHHETEKNLIKLRRDILNHLKYASVSPFSYKYYDYWSVPLPELKSINLLFIYELNKIDLNDLIERAVVVVLLNQKVKGYYDGVLHVSTVDEAVSWFVRNTPYKYIDIRGKKMFLSCVKNQEGISNEV